MHGDDPGQAQLVSLLDFSSGEPRLVGGVCEDCGTVLFPLRNRCTACAGTAVRSTLLAPAGSLWAWTVQRFMPPSPPYICDDPADFVPFPVGYVELGGVIRIESRLLAAPEELRAGMRMKLVSLDLAGHEVFAFAPVDGEDSR
jgi:uncharacterized OB-fold protein